MINTGNQAEAVFGQPNIICNQEDGQSNDQTVQKADEDMDGFSDITGNLIRSKTRGMSKGRK